MWKAYAKAGVTANPDEPDLAVYATGAALTTLRDALRAFKSENQVFKGTYVTDPTVAEATPKQKPTSVVIADCLDTTKFLVYKASGEPVNDAPGGRRSIGAIAKLVDGTWKVTSLAIRKKGTC